MIPPCIGDMGTCMDKSKCEECEAKLADSHGKPFNILSLPVELIVYIMSFLATMRDKVKFRYVSQKLRVVSETPSLWSEFVWPLYDSREERSLMNSLNICGEYIKRFVVPDHVTPSTLFEMLSHCGNVTELSLPPVTHLDSEQLRIAVHHMKHLEKLEVQLSTDINPLLLIDGLKELTVHVPQQYHSLCSTWVQEWMKKGFVPCRLNLIAELYDQEEAVFLQSLLQWSFTPLVGYTSYFKHYKSLRLPLNLYPPIPANQLVFGQTVTLPIIKPSSFGILLVQDMAIVTDCICDDRVVRKVNAGVYNFFQSFVLNEAIDNLNCVTEFDLTNAETLQSENLEQVAVACPNLQRLNIQGNHNCLHPLQGLRMIANHCHELYGLNLKYISVTDMESHLGLWEILSSMSLSHLVAEVCVLHSNSDGEYEQKLIGLFRKCYTLQALQFDSFYDDGSCDVCTHSGIKWSLLSHFPSLKYCNLYGDHPDLVQDVISGCKELMVFFCESIACLLISPVLTANLQQLYIESGDANIPEIFMETVSGHGRLLHVVLFVNCLTIEGIVTLIRNSPELLSFIIHAENIIGRNEITVVDDLGDSLQKKFPDRKLFRVGSFTVGQVSRDVILARTDLLPLWPIM